MDEIHNRRDCVSGESKVLIPQKLVVIDDDGLNPYGLEVCNVLNQIGWSVSLFARGDSPDLLGTELPHRTAGTEFKTSQRNLAGFGNSLTMYKTLMREKTVVVCWASMRQKAILITISAFLHLRVVYVAHNPVPNRIPKGWRNALERLFISRSIPVVHGNSLRESFKEIYGKEPLVAMHPPYMGAVEYKKIHTVTKNSSPKKRILLLGRSSKNQEFPVLEFIRVLNLKFSDFELIVAQRPHLEFSAMTDKLVNLTSDKPMEESALLDLILTCDLILSPSVNVSESGTVILANSLGKNVLAYDSPELRKHSHQFALVTPFNLAGLVAAAAELLSNPSLSTARWTYEDWLGVTCSSWKTVLDASMARD